MSNTKSRQRRQPMPQRICDSARWGQSYREHEQRRLATYRGAAACAMAEAMQQIRAIAKAREEAAKT